MNEHKKDVLDVIKAAQAWRELTGLVGCGGVVILYKGDVQGWVQVLRKPEDWVPGCLAVAEDGRIWTTLAGNAQHGALMWLPSDQIVD